MEGLYEDGDAEDEQQGALQGDVDLRGLPKVVPKVAPEVSKLVSSVVCSAIPSTPEERLAEEPTSRRIQGYVYEADMGLVRRTVLPNGSFMTSVIRGI